MDLKIKKMEVKLNLEVISKFMRQTKMAPKENWWKDHTSKVALSEKSIISEKKY